MRHIHKTRYNEQVLSIASHKLGELKIIEFAREIERIYIYIYISSIWETFISRNSSHEQVHRFILSGRNLNLDKKLHLRRVAFRE